jgi:protein ImuA
VGQGAGTVVLVGSPGDADAAPQPGLPALAAAGLAPGRLLWAPGASSAARLWAAEQALRCADVAAVLAWLPCARPAELRRLQLAAAQRGDGLLFVLRPALAACTASPAPLRLALALDAVGDALVVDVIKRRGPSRVAPLRLPAQSPALQALLAAQEQGGAAAGQAAAARVLPFAPRPGRADAVREEVHAVDRVAVAA